MDDTEALLARARRNAEEARRAGAESRRLVQTSRAIQQWTAHVLGRAANSFGSLLSFNRYSNRLLAILPAAEFARLAPQFTGVTFMPKMVLYRANAPIEYVYFPVSGLLSAMIGMQDGGTISVASIGREGMAGLPAFLGQTISPYDLVVQVPGNGLRMNVSTLHGEVERGGTLGQILGRYRAACAVQDAYEIACNGLHGVGKRCCRLLLSTQNRLATNILPFTHETLALTLGVRRATISDELSAIQARGIVETHRGRITIVDRPQLETLACECYEAITQEFVHLYQSAGVDVSGEPEFAGG